METLHATTLEVANFRGVRKTLGLSFGRRLTLIYGGNATGKSSIAQAIEFVLTGQVVDHQDAPIAPHYLRNTHGPKVGRVMLRLTKEGGSGGFAINAATDESRSQIEHRFREIGVIDWPERQHLPITTTHITSQGALSRVLTSNSVTRSDLSGLCAGAYLRSLLGRAEKLADHFRQATVGRDIQTATREARTAFESAKILRDSLAATSRSSISTNVEPSQIVHALAVDAGLVDVPSLGEIAAAVDVRLDDAEKKLSAIERLLVRMRDLGQYEVEAKQLQSIVEVSRRNESELLQQRQQAQMQLEQCRNAENEALVRQADARSKIGAAEAYQTSIAAANSTIARLEQIKAALQIVGQQVAVLREKVVSATTEQKEKSERLVALEANRRTLGAQLDTIRDGIAALNQLDTESLDQSRATIVERKELVERLRHEEAAAAARLRSAVELESTGLRQLEVMSESDARFLRAVSELKSFAHGDDCSLCGHHHGTPDTLAAAIAATTNTRLASSNRHKGTVDQLSSSRREKASAHSILKTQLATADGALAQAIEVVERLESQQGRTLSRIADSLTRVGLRIPVGQDALSSASDGVIKQINSVDQELLVARLADLEARATLNDLERDLADRSSEEVQLSSLELNLEEQLSAIRANQPPEVLSETATSARDLELAADRTLSSVRRNVGKVAAELAEVERTLSQSQAQGSGASRRLEAIQGLLQGLDAELGAVGATRDVASLLGLEGGTRQLRDDTLGLKGRIDTAKRQLLELERYRAYTDAEGKLAESQQQLERLQVRQTHLGKRAAQFAQLQRELEEVQSRTAEEVLRKVRDPVGLMFRAMTAGCQWDIEFALTTEGRVECKLLTESSLAPLPATRILNSAYLNVAAIALRIALASQQNWTTLRTVVLDDPILEMDSLTQSALIDGLEAILMSPHSPWSDLQLVLTTWSEDFAVLAAHKLAHMNDRGSGYDDFVVYRLGSLPDGDVVPERHVPRWKAQADAA